ncbi:XrtY-associated glycosyltransferase XYAG1 [Nubsella zeaxanthinifaciens]|uniref:XrtY-associated glycosyltransferase XYAG1 n=1 Tax=Nubsella zeaxanthinifaciens TaxID=392412 RepID=UPI003D04A5AA
MKIIQICAAYKPAYVYGGPTMSVAKLAEELTSAGTDVLMLTTTANGAAELDVPVGTLQVVDGVNVYYFKRLTKDHTHFSPSLLRFLHQQIKQHKTAANPTKLIVHIHAWWNLVSIFSCFIAKWHGVKVVLSPRGMLTSYTLNNRNSKVKDILHAVIGKRLLAYAHIHATSKKEEEDVLQNFETKGITIIPNFVALSQQSYEKKQIDEKRYDLLFLSRIEQKKGLEILFEALSKADIPWLLNIAGTGEENYVKQLQELAISLGITDNIKWLGHINNEHKFELIAKHDALVLTSYNENFANVVIESLAMGTPVIISNQVGLANYVSDKQLGWVTNLNASEIASTLINSFVAVELRKQIRDNAPSIIKKDFEANNLTAQYRSMYQRLF